MLHHRHQMQFSWHTSFSSPLSRRHQVLATPGREGEVLVPARLCGKQKKGALGDRCGMGRSACSSLAETLGVKSPAGVKSSDPTGTGAAEIPQEDG